VTLNVGRVTAVTATGLQLAEPLLAGVPAQGMQAQSIVALQDREGGTFFQEWSGLFAMQGEQGDALFFYYPRLQTTGGPAEKVVSLTRAALGRSVSGRFIALPIVDPMDWLAGVLLPHLSAVRECPGVDAAFPTLPNAK